MRCRKYYVEFLLIPLLLSSAGFASEDPNTTIIKEDEEPADRVFSSSTISEKIPETIDEPKIGPNHHDKHKNPTDGSQTHTRSPVYEVVNQPCYSPRCGGYNPQDGSQNNRWQQGKPRYGPYPKYYEPRRRGGYGNRENYPQPGYRENYPQPGYGQYGPETGYGPRGMPYYPQERYDRWGAYGRQPYYDDYFLG